MKDTPNQFAFITGNVVEMIKGGSGFFVANNIEVDNQHLFSGSGFECE